MGGFNIGAGLSAAGGAVSSFAGELGLQAMKADMERQQIELSNKLIAEREHVARVESGVPIQVQGMKLDLANRKAAMISTYALAGVTPPKELLEPGADIPDAIGPQNPSNSGPTAGGTAPAAISAPAGAGNAVSDSPSSLINSDATPSGGASGARPTIFADKKGKTSIAGSLPPGMTPAVAAAMALNQPDKFYALIAKWHEPNNVKGGDSVMTLGAGADGGYGSVVTAPKLGEHEQVAADGSIKIMPGGLQATTLQEAAKSAGQLPAELTKIGATGAQTRQTSAFTENLKDAHELVDAYDPNTKTNIQVPRGVALQRINQSINVPPAPDGSAINPELGAQKDGSFKMPDGFVIPPAPKATTPASSGLEKGPGAVEKANQENYAPVIKELTDSVLPAQQAEQRFNHMADILKDFKSGAWESKKAAIAVNLKAAGFNSDVINKMFGDPAKAQILMKDNFTAALQSLAASRIGRITQNEIFALQDRLANPNLTPEANLEILSEGIGIAKWQQSLAAGWTVAGKMGYDPLTYLSDAVRSNPATQYVNNARSDIGLLKGMEGPGKSQYQDGQTMIQGGRRFKVINGKPTDQGPVQ